MDFPFLDELLQIDDTWASTRPFVEQYIVNEEDEGEDEDGEGEDQ
jgi:hypothetical protein